MWSILQTLRNSLKIDWYFSNVTSRWWGETVLTVDCGEAIARWVSQCLLNVPTGLRMGHYSQPTVPLRTVDNGWTKFLKVYPKLRSHYLVRRFLFCLVETRYIYSIIMFKFCLIISALFFVLSKHNLSLAAALVYTV